MPNGDPFLAGTGGNLETAADTPRETGADPTSDSQTALSAAMQPSAPPAAAPTGGAPAGGGYDPLSGIGQLMGSLNQIQTPQVPAAAQVQQRHGGVLTGLVGVLLDGLASGMAPTTQQAWERPQQRQQMEMQKQQQQMQQQEQQMRMQQAQQEIAMGPLKMKYEMAQTLMNIQHTAAALRGAQKEHWMDMMGAQAKYTEQAREEGRARLDATSPTLDDAQKRTRQLQAQNKDKELNFGYSATKWDDAGNPTEYGVFEYYPHGTLQKPFDHVFKGDKSLGIPDQEVHFTAGTQDSEAQMKFSAVAADQQSQLKMAQDRELEKKMMLMQQEQISKDNIMLKKMDVELARNQAAVQKPALSQIVKPRTDLDAAVSGADMLRNVLRAGGEGNQVASAVAGLSAGLMNISAQGFHRFNLAEVGMFTPEAESLARKIEARLDKNISGAIPKDYAKDLERFTDLFEQAQIRKYTGTVDQINTQFEQTMPGYTRIPYAIPPELEKFGRTGQRGESPDDIVNVKSGGKTIPVYRRNLEAARKRDPKLEVVP